MYLSAMAQITEFKAKAGETGPEVTITVKARMDGDELAELSESLGTNVNLQLSSVQRRLFDEPIRQEDEGEPTPLEQAAETVNEGDAARRFVCRTCNTVKAFGPGEIVPENCPNCGGDLVLPEVVAQACIDSKLECAVCETAGVICDALVKDAKKTLEAIVVPWLCRDCGFFTEAMVGDHPERCAACGSTDLAEPIPLEGDELLAAQEIEAMARESADD